MDISYTKISYKGWIKNNAYAWFEIFLIYAGLCLLFSVDHYIIWDGLVRFQGIEQLVTQGKFPSMKYSLAGHIFSIPLYLLGKIYQNPVWWCAKYNFFLFCFAIFLLYKILRNYNVGLPLIRRFLLILIYASMFGFHLMMYYGEVFSALAVAVGILLLDTKHASWGWCGIILGVLNTPALIIGLLLIVIKKSFHDKRFRYCLVILAVAALYMLEGWLRRGNPFITGYEGGKAVATSIPYLGKPGVFGYPFLFGLLSILFSFGKGIFFFAPGLLLIPLKNRLGVFNNKKFHSAYALWVLFLTGMIILYSNCLVWNGDWFWGPRYFLFASLPASFALAAGLSSPRNSFLSRLLILLALIWSFWVGVNGKVFGYYGFECYVDNNCVLQFVSWYTPEFSILFYPFIAVKPLLSPLWRINKVMIGFSAVTLIYLAFPLVLSLVKDSAKKSALFKAKYLHLRSWRF